MSAFKLMSSKLEHKRVWSDCVSSLISKQPTDFDVRHRRITECYTRLISMFFPKVCVESVLEFVL